MAGYPKTPTNFPNLTLKNATEYEGFGPILGWIYILHTSVYFLPYIPCLIVIFDKRLIKSSCFKIMAFLGILDLQGLLFAGYMSAIFTILNWGGGSHYRLMKILSCFEIFCWTSYCFMVLALGLNRCLLFKAKELGKLYFGGNRVYIWMVASLIYGSIFGIWFMFPGVDALYNPQLGVCLYSTSASHIAGFNNVGVPFVLLAEYIALYIIFRSKAVHVPQHHHSSIELRERMLLLQCMIICFILMICSLLYITIPYLPQNKYVYILCNMSWQMAQGGNAYIYLFLNKSIRKKVIKKLNFFCKPKPTLIPVAAI